MYFASHVLRIKGYLMYDSDAITILNCAFDCPCLFTYGVWKTICRHRKSKLSFIGCVSKYLLFYKLLFLSSRPPQTIGKILEISVAGQKYMCVSGKVVLWSTHFDITTLVPVLYLKLSNHI